MACPMTETKSTKEYVVTPEPPLPPLPLLFFCLVFLVVVGERPRGAELLLEGVHPRVVVEAQRWRQAQGAHELAPPQREEQLEAVHAPVPVLVGRVEERLHGHGRPLPRRPRPNEARGHRRREPRRVQHRTTSSAAAAAAAAAATAAAAAAATTTAARAASCSGGTLLRREGRSR